MFKIIFVLIINAHHGGLATLDFTTRQQCEAAKEKVVVMKGSAIGAICIEKQIPLKKTKCKVINDYSYQNSYSRVNAGNMNGYPYPIALECVEE